VQLLDQLLTSIPKQAAVAMRGQSCAGSALQAGRLLIGGAGGRVTLFQSTLPTLGLGALKMREDPAVR